ncbi:hypothetical protein A3203_12415 [Burkholderia cenocepacia]|uniref:beta strand repeat-containing protein n=1 Tax=Burkholderia cenocepacia TaxID=95486 RepID=UPI00078EB1D9|nr:hypothetical protein [Burkholderia cenocepacia]AMU13845.1 hypothetical protein A3203_12415 [Burkholderia cenocepacia]
MGKLAESSQWVEDLYQIEIADPVEGGPDGVSNTQAKQLGSRTRYLKAQVEQSQTGLAQHVAAADPHTQYALKTDLAAKLAALVGQSPASLDTLKELADALGNDPQFATTVINQLALKAPLDSPQFTGTPKGTMPPLSDSSTRLATTAFVQRALGNFAGYAAYNANTTLTNTSAGYAIQWYGASGGVLTLPVGATMPASAAIWLFNHGAGPVTVTTQGSDVIWGGGNKQPVTLQVGDNLVLMSRGTTEWDIVGGTAAIQFSNVKGVTPAQFDSSNNLATTAFVQQAAGNFQTRKYISGSATLAASDTGSWVEAGGNGPTTITLPAPTTSNIRYTVTNVTSNGAAVTISTLSASIYNQAAAAATFSLDVGATVELVSDASNWTVIKHYTRSPIAQTPPQFDNSTRLATTAFVLRALGGFSGFLGINASTMLNSSVAGQAVQSFATASITATLPLSSTMPVGSCITFFNNGAAGSVMNVATQGSDIITTPGASITSIAMQLGDTLQLMSRGSAEWDIVGGTAAIQFTQTRGVTAAIGDNSTRLATTAFVQRAARTRLTQNTSFYVNASTGSDNNDGLTSGTAWATITKALTALQQNYDLAGYTATVNVAAGSYGPALCTGAFVGAISSASVQVVATGAVTITNPSNGGGAACAFATGGAQYQLSGAITLVNNATGTSCVQASGAGSILNVGSGVTIGFSAGSHFLANALGVVNVNASYSIANNGGAGSHYNVANGGSLNVAGGITVTIGTNVGVTAAFALANGLSQINAAGINFSGAANVTGTRYISQTNSVINSNSGGANYFPGSAAGMTSNGGIYI